MQYTRYDPPLLTQEEWKALSVKEQKKLYGQRLRERRVEMGVCRVCGKHPPAEGKIDCRFCTAKSKLNATEKSTKRRNRLKVAGLCIQCGEVPATPGKQKCYSCSAKSAPKDLARQSARRALFAANGLCEQCGDCPPLEDRNHCAVCTEQRKTTGLVWRTNAKKKAVEYLGGACQDCGLKTDVVQVYDFHHRDPSQKDFGIAKFLTCDFDAVVAPELDKCDLLCSNCHRIRHATNPSFEEIVEEAA